MGHITATLEENVEAAVGFRDRRFWVLEAELPFSFGGTHHYECDGQSTVEEIGARKIAKNLSSGGLARMIPVCGEYTCL